MVLNLHQLVHHAEAFRELFEGSFERWEFAGSIRRQERGSAVEHLVIPRIDKASINLVWARMVELAQPRIKQIDVYVYLPDPADLETQLESCDRLGVHHDLYLATRTNWGVRLVQRTGPAGFWMMLSDRLHHDGTLKIHGGNVCHVNRKDGGVSLDAIEVLDEAEFFRLARTPWKEPKVRFEPKPGRSLIGMRKAWLPEFLLPYADPAKHPELFGGREYRPRKRRKT